MVRTFVLQTHAPSHSGKPEACATFKWHTKAITGVEWHPTDASVLVVSGEDDQVSLWDMAVEADEANVLKRPGTGEPIPPQLLFVHQGQKDVKEVHWHPQLPGVVLSTAGSGFNIFKSISV
jgi:ribosome assembly protein RRB1